MQDAPRGAKGDLYLRREDNRRMGRAKRPADLSTYSGRCAARLRALREEAGLTVEQLAAKINRPAATLYHWEVGRYKIDLDAVPALAKALKTTPRELLAAK